MSNNKTLIVKVAGVTYDGRQHIIADLSGDEPCRLIAEPDNKYDPNAIGVWVATSEGKAHIGYVPRELAAQIAPHLDGSLDVKIDQIVGGNGYSYGVRLRVELPPDMETPQERGYTEHGAAHWEKRGRGFKLSIDAEPDQWDMPENEPKYIDNSGNGEL